MTYPRIFLPRHASFPAQWTMRQELNGTEQLTFRRGNTLVGSIDLADDLNAGYTSLGARLDAYAAGLGAQNLTLQTNVSSGAATVPLPFAPVHASTIRWIALSLGTTSCEVLACTVSGSTATLTGTTSGAHNSGALIGLLDRPELHPHWFGAVADGVTDDATALQAWLDAAISHDMIATFGPGIYYTSTGLVADHTKITDKNGLVMRGAGTRRDTRILFDGTGFALDISGDGNTGDDNITRYQLSGFSIYGGENTTSDGGIKASRSFLVHLSDLEIGAFWKSSAILLDARNAFTFTVENTHIFGGTADVPYAQSGILIGSVDEGAGQPAWSSSNIMVKDCIIQRVAGYGIELDSAHAGSLDTLNIINNDFGINQGGHVYVSNPGGGGVRVTTVRCTGNHFELAGQTSSSTADFVSGVYFKGCDSVICEGNHFNVGNVHQRFVDVGVLRCGYNTHVTSSGWQGIFSDQTVSSITRSASTATVTTASAHNYATGALVAIEGANEGEYNGVHSITVTGSTTFTYTVSGSPGTPATGSITSNASIAFAIECPATATRGTLGPFTVYQPQVGTTFYASSDTMYLSWEGVVTWSNNTLWNRIALRYPNALQGTLVNENTPAFTSRSGAEFMQLRAFTDGATDLQVLLANRRIQWGTGTPGSGTWSRGDIVFNESPSAAGTIGWVCTTAGTPGTWKTFGTIAS